MGWASCPPILYLITPKSAVKQIMRLEKLLLPFREEILKIATKYGAYNMMFFGSVTI